MIFRPKEDKFTVLLSKISSNLKTAADYYYDFPIRNVSDLKACAAEMKRYENTGDSYVHELIMELNNAFITPLEREDILQLAMSMDDVLDGFESITAMMEMYSIINIDDYMKQSIDMIRQAAIEIDQAAGLLSSKKLSSIHPHSIKIKEIETACDTIYRKSVKNLFETQKDPIRILQFKEIYDRLEEIADYCQTVANSLETIIMKNA